MLLIVMYESQTWRVHPGEPFTFGRSPQCSAVLPMADRGLSRTAGSFRHHDRWWWLHNDSGSSVLCLLGDRGFRVDLPPGLQVPLQQWHAKVTLTGEGNGFVRTVSTTHEGFFSLPDLTPATFTISIEAPGFKTYRETGILIGAVTLRLFNGFVRWASIAGPIDVTILSAPPRKAL